MSIRGGKLGGVAPDDPHVQAQRNRTAARQARRTINLTESKLHAAVSGVSNLLQSGDRVVGARPTLGVSAVTSGVEIPSLTDGSVIYIDRDVFTEAINGGAYETAVLYGLNYHELAHIMYTPFIYVRIPNFDQYHVDTMFNILEDQRIEKQLIERYARTRYYLMAAVSRYYFSMREPTTIPANLDWMTFVGVCERRYIPAPLRHACRSAMVNHFGEFKASRIEDLISEYVRLDIRSDSTILPIRAEKIIKAMLELLSVQNMTTLTQNSRKLHMDSGTKEQRGNRSKPLEENATFPSKEEEERRDEPGAPGEPGEGGATGDSNTAEDKPGDSQAGDGQGQGDGESDKPGENAGDGPGGTESEGSSDGSDKPGDGAGEGEGSNDGTPGGTGASSSEAPSKGRNLNTMQHRAAAREAIKKALEEVLKDAGVKKDASQVKQVVTNSRMVYTRTDELSTFEYEDVTPEMRKDRDSFITALSRYQDVATPGWDEGNSYGRVNMDRVIRGDDRTTVFDAWREDRQEGLDVEAWLCVDLSGSMENGNGVGESPVIQVSQAAWAIKSGLERGINARVHKIGYSNKFAVIHPTDEREQANRYRAYESHNATMTLPLLGTLAEVTSRSKHKHRVVVFLTDGIWAGYGLAGVTQNSYTNALAILNESGVKTSLAYYGVHPDKAPADNYGFSHAAHVTNGKEFSTYVRDLVVGIIDKGTRW